MEIRTPVEGFTGTVAGVGFADGVGHTDNPSAIAYFTRHGYQVGGGEGKGKSAPTKAELVARAEELEIELPKKATNAQIAEAIAAREAEMAAAGGQGEGGQSGESQ